MASGSFTSGKYSSGYSLKVNWTSTPNEKNNSSYVTIEVYLVLDPWYKVSVGERYDAKSTINGSNYTESTPQAKDMTGTNTVKNIFLWKRSVTVPHNQDGTKSVTLTAMYPVRATLSGIYHSSFTASKTVTLDNITRAYGMKVWNGSRQVRRPVKTWTGTKFAMRPVKEWNGSRWVRRG